jgi:Leucine-rich repeat (LRR) protein
MLNLAQNHIAVLPIELWKPSELDNLNISGNQLETLPNSIVALNKLRRLNIALNRFDALPDSIERWLKELYDKGCIVIRGGVSSESL